MATMSDVVVTVPKRLWREWLAEGDLPGQEPQYASHFWFGGPIPKIEPGERVYIVAHGRVRGYAPLVAIERCCALDPSRHCLLRAGGAVAVTPRCRRHHGRVWECNRFETGCPTEDHPLPVQGFRGVLYRWWPREIEMPFLEWMWEGVGETRAPLSQGALL
jgi:hypothetical protein